MKVTWGLENASHNPSTVTTLGSYDGVHLGHQQILARLAERKHELGLERSLLLTFHPHPQEVLCRDDSSIELLTTIEERLHLFEQYGIDETVVIKFSREFAQTSYIDFFCEIIARQLGTRAIVVGFNHAFGKDRKGDAEKLKVLAPVLGISIEEVPPVVVDDVAISSTKIRNALNEGALEQANTWLGRSYSFTGRVVHGDALGRTLGYPTANIEVEAPKLVPADGVYAAQVRVGSTPYSAALSIGTKPTVQNDGPRTIEALLVNFEGDLYCETLTVDCTRYLRPQEKFASLEELKQAIARDVAAIG